MSGLDLSSVHPQAILAAGGIVRKERRGSTQIAVIHRTHHHDWTLPKGKLKGGETPFAAAVREVEEETGVNPQPTEFVGTVSYHVAGRPKIVFFWDMVAQKQGGFIPSEEVDALIWLDPKSAIKKLDHFAERALIAQRFAIPWRDTGARGLDAVAAHLLSWRRVVRSRSYRRLDGAIRAQGRELEWRAQATADGQSKEWSIAARSLLAEARQFLRLRMIDEGWNALMAAQRLEVFALNDMARATRAKALRGEAESKLRSWRRSAVLAALPQGRLPDAESLWFATLLRDENSQNEYRKVAALTDQITTMGIFVGALLLLIVVLSSYHPVPLLDMSYYDGSFELLIYVLLFGMLGGAVSTMIPRDGAHVHHRVPEALSDTVFSRLRPLLGGASAMIVYFAAKAELLPFTFTAAHGAAVLLLAFAAGFSERLIVRAIEGVFGRQEESKRDRESERGPDSGPVWQNISGAELEVIAATLKRHQTAATKGSIPRNQVRARSKKTLPPRQELSPALPPDLAGPIASLETE